mgnify:CR=1 FL=1
MIFEHMDRIVFAGDSVTDMESAQPVGEGLFENVGKSYVRIVENMLAAFYPEVYLRVTNSGIGGNTSRDLLQRFDRDVVSLTGFLSASGSTMSGDSSTARPSRTSRYPRRSTVLMWNR